MMTIEHLEVTWDALPQYQTLALKAVAKPYRKIMFIERTIGLLILLVAFVILYFTMSPLQNAAVMIGGIIGFVLIAAFVFWLAAKAFANKGFALREKDMIHRKGWLFETTIIVPLSKIQHCSVKTGPLERYFGLSSLNLYTAGTNTADFTLNGLTTEEAHQLKDWILEQLNPTSNHAEGLD